MGGVIHPLILLLILLKMSNLAKLRSLIPVSEIVGKRVKLTKKGHEFGGLCPFHQEKTPSFTVNDDKGFYHCFGCGAHGDIIKFLTEYEKMEFQEALKYLASIAGITLAAPSKQQQEAEIVAKSLAAINEKLAKIYAQELYKHDAKTAQKYLVGRKLSAAILEKFKIGFSTPGLFINNQNHDISISELKNAGILADGERGVYERFSGRIIFPIANREGKIIAFGGRIVEKSSNAAKYINSIETEIFKKGENLYAENLIDKKLAQVILVEGYIDVISLVQAGITNVVAPLGTAITESQLRKLWYYTKEPIICLDGDKAGQKAAFRAAELALPMLKAGYSLRFCKLPNAKDPDDVIQEKGAEYLKDILKKSINMDEFIWEYLLAEIQPSTPEAVAFLQQSLEEVANLISDKTISKLYLKIFRDKIWQSFFKNKKAITNYNKEPLKFPKDNNSIKLLLAMIAKSPSLLENHELCEQFENLEIEEEIFEKIRVYLLESRNESLKDSYLLEFEDIKFAIDELKSMQFIGDIDSGSWLRLLLQYKISMLKTEYQNIINNKENMEQDFVLIEKLKLLQEEIQQLNRKLVDIE